MLSNDPSGVPPLRHCAFDASLPLALLRLGVGCGGGSGRYVVVSGAGRWALPPQVLGAEVVLTDDAPEVGWGEGIGKGACV